LVGSGYYSCTWKTTVDGGGLNTGHNRGLTTGRGRGLNIGFDAEYLLQVLTEDSPQVIVKVFLQVMTEDSLQVMVGDST